MKNIKEEYPNFRQELHDLLNKHKVKPTDWQGICISFAGALCVYLNEDPYPALENSRMALTEIVDNLIKIKEEGPK
jgi:hypothetical protein